MVRGFVDGDLVWCVYIHGLVAFADTPRHFPPPRRGVTKPQAARRAHLGGLVVETCSRGGLQASGAGRLWDGFVATCFDGCVWV